ncbi:MAG TPA: hypothetical protein VN927_01010 [Gemmatimonadaceae bacterium]|nr:hypothetical protein [Gemmatimonadaceae bacterium]
MKKTLLPLLTAIVAFSSAAVAQGPPDPKVLIAAQREGMAPLAYMDGVWRGPATTTLPSGEVHNITQTERIGPFLDGSVKVIEGRGYEPDGRVGFNALAVISYDPASRKYTMRSYAQGYQGDFVITQTADGYVWEIPAGPTTIRYTAVVKDGKWREVGDRIIPGRPPIRFFEMNLVRVGNSDWPGAGAISPK